MNTTKRSLNRQHLPVLTILGLMFSVQFYLIAQSPAMLVVTDLDGGKTFNITIQIDADGYFTSIETNKSFPIKYPNEFIIYQVNESTWDVTREYYPSLNALTNKKLSIEKLNIHVVNSTEIQLNREGDKLKYLIDLNRGEIFGPWESISRAKNMVLRKWFSHFGLHTPSEQRESVFVGSVTTTSLSGQLLYKIRYAKSGGLIQGFVSEYTEVNTWTPEELWFTLKGVQAIHAWKITDVVNYIIADYFGDALSEKIWPMLLP